MVRLQFEYDFNWIQIKQFTSLGLLIIKAYIPIYAKRSAFKFISQCSENTHDWLITSQWDRPVVMNYIFFVPFFFHFLLMRLFRFTFEHVCMGDNVMHMHTSSCFSMTFLIFAVAWLLYNNVYICECVFFIDVTILYIIWI